jgi:hypothetical protein
VSREAGLFVAVFLAAAVEAVEAATIVLAAGLSRGWRAALTGAGRRPSSARGGGGRARTGPRHFQSFEQDRLEADREPVAVVRTASAAAGAGGLELAREDAVLVVQRAKAAGAQDRLMRMTRPYGSMIRATSAPTPSPELHQNANRLMPH